MRHERKYDELLNVSTTGIREWQDRITKYNRYEATPYKALHKLFRKYMLNKGDELIDFGCGRGRVSFYVHDHFQIPVTGIEANDQTFEELLCNETSYLRKNKQTNAPLYFDYGLAESYEIVDTANCFYFFNPFSAEIFKKVVQNILRSIERKQRAADIILYYPLPAYKRYLKQNTPFKLLKKVKVPGDHGKYGKFLIYRFHQEI